MSSSTDPDSYSVVWKNASTRGFKLFQAGIRLPHAGEVPPSGFELLPNEEVTLKWTSPSTDRDPVGSGTTFGFLRFWSIPDLEKPKPVDGLTFGVKLEREYDGGEPLPYKVLTCVGSPTGNPDSWTDVTTQFNPDYTFFVNGPEPLDMYHITIKRLLGLGASIEVTIKSIAQAPTKDIRPRVGSYLHPGSTVVLAWSCPVPEDSGNTFGFLRYWVDKGDPQDSKVLGIRIDEKFEISEVDGKKSEPQMPQASIFMGAPEACLWVNIDKELQVFYHAVVEHKPVSYVFTVYTIAASSGDPTRCALQVAIDKNGPIWPHATPVK
ncbi:hypothetical protein CALCODRAFT_507165 [Calocera cornea HHB12733]|uniref:Uncharacterized protein n=1 Tax=Calocera cornea HHB12733 TaxID=1353952 RepID=A0A165I164_9BASI|nr:hypothetical protein CALCODRAFT_507165 [Calocera cornea HHB12733]